jgi:hypothetical protein
MKMVSCRDFLEPLRRATRGKASKEPARNRPVRKESNEYLTMLTIPAAKRLSLSGRLPIAEDTFRSYLGDPLRKVHANS